MNLVEGKLSRTQKLRVGALIARKQPRFAELLAAESDLDVLREVNFQFRRMPDDRRTIAVLDRIEAITGKRPQTGRTRRVKGFKALDCVDHEPDFDESFA